MLTCIKYKLKIFSIYLGLKDVSGDDEMLCGMEMIETNLLKFYYEKYQFIEL